MVNSRKFVAKTKDVSLTVRRADSFSISYVNCEKDIFHIEENQDGIKLVQTEKVSAFYWLHCLLKAVLLSLFHCRRVLIFVKLKLSRIKY